MQELLTQSNEEHTPVNAKNFLRALGALPPHMKSVFVITFFVFLLTSIILLIKFNDHFLVEVPRHGGSLSEGIIGRPRFINPIIAKSDADRDMSALIYSGLLKATPKGELIPDLADHVTKSDDGLTYTFTLRDDLVWHDGEPITSADVLFTIEKVKDAGLAIKSPRRASWEGVTVATPDPKTVIFTIKQPYALFLENATMGIIPKHIWQNVPNDEFDVTYYNIKPIGSGPYRVDSVVQDKDNGLPQYYDLVAFKRYALGAPYITHLRMTFFGNNKELTQSYTNQSVDQIHTIEPVMAEALEKSGARIVRAPLPRIFAAYFNQNQQPIFVSGVVRQALALAVDKNRVVNEVLHGYGRTIDGPLFSLVATYNANSSTTAERVAAARDLLEHDGWAQNAVGVYEKTDKKKKKITLLQFSMAIPDVPELRATAEILKSNWKKMGASVTLKVYDSSTFAAEVLSPRKYDVVFYGQVTGRTPDPFAYWHSSQRNSPGLNIALYTNKNVDKYLEDARKENDPVRHADLLAKFATEIAKDTPAVFVYSPDFLYATSPRVQGAEIGLITTESERFLNIEKWYVESERVWKWFAQ